MLIETLLINIVTSVIQSLFGVVILLFGTPLLLLIGIFIYFIVEKVIYSRINNQKYSEIFSGFLFVTGFMLIVKDSV